MYWLEERTGCISCDGVWASIVVSHTSRRPHRKFVSDGKMTTTPVGEGSAGRGTGHRGEIEKRMPSWHRVRHSVITGSGKY